MREVALFRRENDWRPEVFTEGTVPLDCLVQALPLEATYEDVAID